MQRNSDPFLKRATVAYNSDDWEFIACLAKLSGHGRFKLHSDSHRLRCPDPDQAVRRHGNTVSAKCTTERRRPLL